MGIGQYIWYQLVAKCIWVYLYIYDKMRGAVTEWPSLDLRDIKAVDFSICALLLSVIETRNCVLNEQN